MGDGGSRAVAREKGATGTQEAEEDRVGSEIPNIPRELEEIEKHLVTTTFSNHAVVKIFKKESLFSTFMIRWLSQKHKTKMKITLSFAGRISSDFCQLGLNGPRRPCKYQVLFRSISLP